MANMYDIVVIGGGPGGYSAALYAARAGLHVAVIEKQTIGGQAIRSENIENYPGFDAGIDGLRLSEKMQRGAERFGAEMVTDEVRRVHLMQPVKVIEAAKQTYQAPTVILATGAPPRKLGDFLKTTGYSDETIQNLFCNSLMKVVKLCIM